MAAARTAATQTRPLNVVLMLADDLGWADTELHADDLHRTPNLLKLARSSVRFTNAYSAAPVCTPTRAALMTGKHPARLRMTIWREASQTPPSNRKVVPPKTQPDLPHSEQTIAEALRERGYFNTHIGKWHLGAAEHYPETQGFDVNVGASLWGAPESFWYPYAGNKRWPEPRYVPGLGEGKPGEYLTDRLTSEAIRRMQPRDGNPFFVNLWFHSPHTPIEGKPELVERYRNALKPEHQRRNVSYAAMVHSLDENVGRVLKHLEDTRQLDNTLVIFTSDNGGFIGRDRNQKEPVTSNHPLRSGKGSLYEGGIRVPLLVHWPGVAAKGATCGEPVSSMDLFATILDAAGANPAGPIDGMSLAPVLRDPRAKLARERLYFHYPHYYDTTSPVSAVRERDWKLLEYHEDQRAEVYDLGRDPFEREDLAAKEPARAARLRAELHRWREEIRAQMPSHLRN